MSLEDGKVYKEEAQATLPLTDGDVVCEDDGTYIGDYDCKSGPPIEMSLLYKGYWWTYKLDRKDKDEDAADEPADAG